MKVQNVLERAIDNRVDKITREDISQHTGINKALISKFFAGTRELSLCDVLKVTRLVAPDVEKDVIRHLVRDYIESPKPGNVKVALLYLVNNYMYDEMEALGKSIPAAHKENIAWYKLIEALALHKKGEVVGYEMITSILNIAYDSPDFNALKSTIYAHGHYSERDFKFIFNFAKDAETYAAQISSEFIRNSIFNTVFELMANAYLFRRNDPKKCRFYAAATRESCLTSPVTHINNDYITGVSYMFEDFDQALTYLNRSVEGLEKLGRHQRAQAIVQDDIAFLYNYWRKPLPISSAVPTSALAYRYFVLGKQEQAEMAALSLGTSAFDLFVKGLIQGNDSLLLMSAMEYRLRGNEFFATLPIKCLKSESIRNDYLNSVQPKIA